MAAEPGQDVREQLAKPVQYVKGVGPRLAQVLQRIGLRTVQDVLFFFPRDYEDVSRIRPIEELDAAEPVTVLGTITEAELRNTRSRQVGIGSCHSGPITISACRVVQSALHAAAHASRPPRAVVRSASAAWDWLADESSSC